MTLNKNNLDDNDQIDYNFLVKKLLLIILSLIFNFIMLKFFLKSFNLNGSSKATVFNFSFNFIFTVYYNLFIILVFIRFINI